MVAVIRIHQQNIFSLYGLKNAFVYIKIFVVEGMLMVVFKISGSQIRKVHEMLEVVVAPAGNKIVLIQYFYFLHQKLNDVLCYLTVVSQADGISFFSLL